MPRTGVFRWTRRLFAENADDADGRCASVRGVYLYTEYPLSGSLRFPGVILYAVSVMSMNVHSNTPAGVPPKSQPAPAAGHRTGSRGPRLVLTVLAVSVALIGLLSLAAVLVTAFLQGEVWPGFVAGAYVCLPVAFLLMTALVLAGVRSRGRE